MDNKLIVNIIHRPELSPEYSKNALGKAEDTTDESLEIFKFQQACAHKYNLRTTIQITYASLFSDVIVKLAKEHHEKYGDEIGLSLLGLPCEEFKAKYQTEDFCIWMFSDEDKKKIVDDCFSLFHQKFGFYPKSTGSYFLDAYTINYIKEKYPSVECAVATCFEEGPKAYHTCNNSWYTFMDGGPWNPWIPSKLNSHCPASSKEDDSGIVAIPHLSRDLLACFDGNGSNFGTHPQNVLRGMIYYNDNGSFEYPYLYNLIDQYHHLGKYNNDFSYNMMFVGPGWLNKKGRWEASYELLAKSYEDGMKYYGHLKKAGHLVDMTMSELAQYYRATHPDYRVGESALWKDILYGSTKQQFWYASPYFRFALDFNQGGAMIDLRPYAARCPQEIGIGHKEVYDASYPYLIQANYRAGYFTHYAGAGTVKSCKVRYHGLTVDLCLTKTMAKFERKGLMVHLKTNPVEINLDNQDIKIESEFIINEETGELITIRRLLNEVPDDVEFEEYFTGAFGTHEYQAPLYNLLLGVDEKEMKFDYKGKSVEKANAKEAYVVIPDIQTKIILKGDNDRLWVTEGIAFSPNYRLALAKKIRKGEIKSCLILQKAN